MLNKILLVAVLFVYCSGIFSQSSNAVKIPKHSQKEGTTQKITFPFYTDGKLPVPFFTFVPASAVPGLKGFSDYATNGNTLNQIIARNDTVIVGFIYVDSLEAPNANGGTSVRMSYNYSVNNGTTWESTSRLDLSPNKSRWPDLFFLTPVSSSVTLGGSGRLWTTPTLRAGGVTIDAILGGSTGTSTFLPGTGQAGNTDYFSDKMTNGKIAGVWQRNDTIYSQNYDPSTNTFGNRNFVFETPSTDFVASYDVYASTTGNTIHTFYNFINESTTNGGEQFSVFRYQKSTDEGVTWSPVVKIMASGMLGSDSAQPYWHQDCAIRPTNQEPYLVFSTQPNTLYGNWDPGGQLMDENRRGYNVCIWSPNLNGGVPVRVASYLNVDVLSDTNLFKQVTRLRTIVGIFRFGYQVNASIVGHPSIGFSNDGSVIHVAFEVARPDTSIEGFNFFDIFTTKSTDGGVTWSNPVNQTNTTAEDEMYPVVSKTGNDNSGCRFTYQSTSVPGCQGFGVSSVVESQIIAPVYQCFRSTLIGIQNISSEVPARFELMQNYPNPFNPVTKIRFAVPKAGNVSIRVFDITGKLVETIAKDEFVTPGTKEVEFNASGFASGVYFYTLNSGDFSETKKMILVK